MNNKNPAISVIIPLYNAEKYIIPCLNSILDQTFKNFEVIVIDDCSTDNSISIVENISPKFDEKLHLVKRNKNSGGAAIPRNIGMKFAQGKYITFIDNDDLFINNALECLYEVAEENQADVVHAEKHLSNFNKNEEINNDTKFFISYNKFNEAIDKINFESDKLSDRIIAYSKNTFFGNWVVWNKLFRRDFIIENYLEFPNLKVADDMMFNFFCLCLAKKYIHVPNITYIYRERNDSFSRDSGSIEDDIYKWTNLVIEGTKILDNFMNDIDFFNENLKYKYMVFDLFIQYHLNYHMNKIYLNFQPYQLDSLLRKIFSDKMFDNTALITYLFSSLNVRNLQINQANQIINKLKQQINSL